MKRFWLSWYGYNGTFELHSPWWLTGYCGEERFDRLGFPMGDATFCAAIIAEHGLAAKNIVRAAHDDQEFAKYMEFRFCEERARDWSPFGSRFIRGDWMQWPAT